jgi:hypothetical protein
MRRPSREENKREFIMNDPITPRRRGGAEEIGIQRDEVIMIRAGPRRRTPAIPT